MKYFVFALGIMLAAAPSASATTSGPRGRAAVSSSVPDGAGGVYVTWAESIRDEMPSDVVLLRVTASGTPAAGWPTEGVPVCQAPGVQVPRALVSDGANGVIVVWEDSRRGLTTIDLYAQRVSSAGVTQWTHDGVPVRLDTAADSVKFAADGAGGFVVGWTAPGAGGFDVLATRIGPTGSPVAGWSPSRTVAQVTQGDAVDFGMCGDRAGGAYFSWSDVGADPDTTYAFAQHVSAAGSLQWGAGGLALATSSLYFGAPTLCSDSGSGVIMSWYDPDTGFRFANRFDSTGNPLWSLPSVLHDVLNSGGFAASESDGLGGAVFTWARVTGARFVYFGQHVTAAGDVTWNAAGSQIGSFAISGITPVLCTAAGASGDADFVWQDLSRPGLNGNGAWWAQRIDATGAAQWGLEGRRLGSALNTSMPPSVFTDAGGKLLAAWLEIGTVVAFSPAEIRVQLITAAGDSTFPGEGALAHRHSGAQLALALHQTSVGGVAVLFNAFDGQGGFTNQLRILDPNGAPSGPTHAIATGTAQPVLIGAVDDGSGGLVVAWSDYRNGTANPFIYAQRLDPTGAPLWGAAGVPVCTAGGFRVGTGIVTDGAGGAIIAWSDARVPLQADAYVQRVSAAGVPQWAANGITVGATPWRRILPHVAADATGGVIISWMESVPAPADTQSTPDSLYAQRIDAIGVRHWGADGSLYSVGAPGVRTLSQQVVAGTANGALLLSHELTSTGNSLLAFTSALRVHRLDGSGATMWGAQGVTVRTGSLLAPLDGGQMVADGSGGIYVAWTDGRSGATDVYAQHLDASGTPQWTSGGVGVCTAPGWQTLTGLTRDPSGDLYLVWDDARGTDSDVYAQRLNASGAAQWGVDGRLVCNAAHGQFGSTVAPFVTSAPARLYVGWTDDRLGNVRYAYAERLDLSGAAQWSANGVTSTALSLVSADADPAGVRLEWLAARAMTATLERRDATHDWARIADVASDGSGQVRYVDAQITPGESYDYRLAYSSAGHAAYSDLVHVLVPLSFRLALAGAQPNPVVGRFQVAFTLPQAGDARLDVIDASGRRVQSRTLAAAPPGPHVVAMGEQPLAPGVYFVRLEQAGRSLSKRLVVLE